MESFITPLNIEEKSDAYFRCNAAKEIAAMMEAYAEWKAANEHFAATNDIKSLNAGVKAYNKLNEASRAVTTLWFHRKSLWG